MIAADACAPLTGFDLFVCVAQDERCLPREHRHLLPYLAAVAEQESGFNPYAIRDETTGASIFPKTRTEATAAATARLRAGHVLGLGWFQITGSDNQRRHWGDMAVTLSTWHLPCANMRAGANHYAADIEATVSALAMGRYNSGRVGGSPAYMQQTMARVPTMRARLAALPPTHAAPVEPPAAPVAKKPPRFISNGRSVQGGVQVFGRRSGD